MRKKKIDYYIQNISKDREPSYKAVIPGFSSIVYGDNLNEIEVGVQFSIECEVNERKASEL